MFPGHVRERRDVSDVRDRIAESRYVDSCLRAGDEAKMVFALSAQGLPNDPQASSPSRTRVLACNQRTSLKESGDDLAG